MSNDSFRQFFPELKEMVRELLAEERQNEYNKMPTFSDKKSCKNCKYMAVKNRNVRTGTSSELVAVHTCVRWPPAADMSGKDFSRDGIYSWQVMIDPGDWCGEWAHRDYP